MSNSEQLSKNKKQHVNKSMYSTWNENILKNISGIIINELNNMLINTNFKYKIIPKLSLNDLVYILKNNHSINANNLSTEYLDTYISPDWWIILLQNEKTLESFIVWISEAKRQWTNDIRSANWLKKQAKWNAIERLWKNLSFVRTIFKHEDITPFVCFGHWSDFEKGSTILWRVIQMNHWYKLNQLFLNKDNKLDPVSFFFRKELWSEDEVYNILKSIIIQSSEYYNKKYNLWIF